MTLKGTGCTALHCARPICYCILRLVTFVLLPGDLYVCTVIMCTECTSPRSAIPC